MLVRQRIVEERNKNGMTTAELAGLLGVNRATISRWENGYIKSIPADTIKKLAEVFHMSLEELIDNDSDYYYLLPAQKKKHSASSELTDDENAMLDWYRHLTSKEKKLVRKLWKTA